MHAADFMRWHEGNWENLMNNGELMRGMARTILAASLFMLSAVALSHARSQTSPAGIVYAAERGNASAQTQLGFMYENGFGVPQDYQLAAMWYHRAAEQGDPRAQHRLGILFNKGFGVRTNFIESYKWLNLAAARVRARERGHYARMRDAVASKLYFPELTEGQLRARIWRPERER
jgi:TPR repeat protein